MAESLIQTKLLISANGGISNPADNGDAQFLLKLSETLTLTSGSAAGQADRVFSDDRTTDDTGESLDLYGGLTSALGNTINFDEIKAIIITASSANTVNVIVGGAAATQFAAFFGTVADTLILKPGATFVLALTGTGYAVADGVSDLLKIAASAVGSVDYTITLIGVSA